MDRQLPADMKSWFKLQGQEDLGLKQGSSTDLDLDANGNHGM